MLWNCQQQSTARLVGNEGNVIMVAYEKCKCGLSPLIKNDAQLSENFAFPNCCTIPYYFDTTCRTHAWHACVYMHQCWRKWICWRSESSGAYFRHTSRCRVNREIECELCVSLIKFLCYSTAGNPLSWVVCLIRLATTFWSVVERLGHRRIYKLYKYRQCRVNTLTDGCAGLNLLPSHRVWVTLTIDDMFNVI